MSNDLIPESNNSIQKFLPSNNAASQLEYDLDYTRQNLQTLIELGIDGVSKLAVIVDQSQNSLDYERLGGLLTNIAGLQQELLKISMAKSKSATDGNNGNVTNNLFVGSTTEMAKLLSDLQKKND